MTERLLLIRLGAVGDLIHTLPLAGVLRDAFPSAEFVWAVEPGPAALLEGNPDVDRLFLVDTRAWRRSPFSGGGVACLGTLRELAQMRPDVAIDAQGLVKSGFLAWVSGAKIRIGFEHRACREGWNVLFTTHWATPPNRPHHVVEKNLSLLGPLGIPVPPPAALRFPLPERPEEGEAAQGFLGREGLAQGAPILAIHPGAGWETKRWDVERYGVLADAWIDVTGGAVLLTWGPGEEGIAREVARKMRSVPSIAPPTGIRELAALLRRCAAFAGGDTGPMHLAAALEVPCLALMGPTEPVRNGPWGRRHAVLHRRLACSGCYNRTCADIECLDRLTAQEAVRQLVRLWEFHESG